MLTNKFKKVCRSIILENDMQETEFEDQSYEFYTLARKFFTKENLQKIIQNNPNKKDRFSVDRQQKYIIKYFLKTAARQNITNISIKTGREFYQMLKKLGICKTSEDFKAFLSNCSEENGNKIRIIQFAQRYTASIGSNYSPFNQYIKIIEKVVIDYRKDGGKELSDFSKLDEKSYVY